MIDVRASQRAVVAAERELDAIQSGDPKLVVHARDLMGRRRAPPAPAPLRTGWTLATLSCGLDSSDEVTLCVLVLGPVRGLRARLFGAEWCGATLALVQVPGERSPRWVNAERLCTA